MYATDPRDALAVAHQHTTHLRTETAARRLRRAKQLTCPVAALVRRFAGRRRAATLAHGPA